ncbi:MAG: ribonuclease E, partial [Aeromonas sp.]
STAASATVIPAITAPVIDIKPEPVAVAAPVAKPVSVAVEANAVTQGAGLLARARKASAPMATPAQVPVAPTAAAPVNTTPLVRSEVTSSGRHAGSTAAVCVATSPAGRP